MNTEAHVALGWVLAHLGGEETRRFRGVVVLAAVIPDLDTVAWFFGERAYANCHHAVGHNVFVFTAFSIVVAALMRRAWWKVFLFTQIALYTHYLGDYFLTRFPLEFFWPIPHRPFIYGYKIGLDHPINNALSYLSFVVIIVMGVMYKRTPMELLSRELDLRIVNLFREKTLACAVCEGKGNERCSVCGEAVCMRHGRIGRRFRVICPRCRGV